jgi:hypothetical protein
MGHFLYGGSQIGCARSNNHVIILATDSLKRIEPDQHYLSLSMPTASLSI